jgi:hypothetical protein
VAQSLNVFIYDIKYNCVFQIIIKSLKYMEYSVSPTLKIEKLLHRKKYFN